MVKHLQSMITGYKRTCSLLAVLKLGIFDGLLEKDCSLDELAQHICATPEKLKLLLIYFESEGFLHRTGEMWGISEDFKAVSEKLNEFKPIIDHEENLYRKWITPESIVSAVKAGIGEREFDITGLGEHGNDLYNKAMYGKNVDIIAFWIRRQIKDLKVATILEYGRSPGVLASALEKKTESKDIDVVVQDGFYDEALKNIENSCIKAYKYSQFKGQKKYNLICLFNTIHYYSKVEMRSLLEKLCTMMAPDSILCIADIFYKEKDEFLQGLLLDWITHGGINNIFVDQFIELLGEVGFKGIKVKSLPEITTELIFCTL